MAILVHASRRSAIGWDGSPRRFKARHEGGRFIFCYIDLDRFKLDLAGLKSMGMDFVQGYLLHRPTPLPVA